MSREHFLALLRSYDPLDEADRETQVRFLEFVEQHEECFQRSLAKGHVTGSSWLLDASGEKVLLTHHKKLGKWLQLGGHADGDSDVLRVAVREAEEESGIVGVKSLSDTLFDLDIHEIPARGEEPTHLHYDARFLLQVPPGSRYQVSEESHDLGWVEISRLEEYSTEWSLLRMREKHLRLGSPNAHS